MIVKQLGNDNDNMNQQGNLYVVATPIGNRNDITLRAIKIFEKVDLVAAEDTRHTGKLFEFHKIKSRFVSYHQHNEIKRTPELIQKLNQGISIALVSNAGTPSVSDPGYRLIKEAAKSGVRVIPIPGVSAVTTALSAAGMPTDSYVFAGFLAKKKVKRLKQLKELADEKRTIVFYESPRRMEVLLENILDLMGNRYGVLCREMTKLHEEFLRGNLSEIYAGLKKRIQVKGECTLLVSGCLDDERVSINDLRFEIRQRLKNTDSRLSELVKDISRQFGISKNKVYAEALKIKETI